VSNPAREQRLVFGEVARQYHCLRPGYPEAVFQALQDYAGLEPGSKVLEIGAGTGKATGPMLRRGWRLVALEPDPEMARVARAAVKDLGEVDLLESTFEAWAEPEEAFAALVAAQSWHWVDPAMRYPKASRVLRNRGTLALVWNRPQDGDPRIREQLDRVYSRLAPHIATGPPGELQGDRRPEIARAGGFDRIELVRVPWEVQYSAPDYAELMRTQSDHRLLAPELLETLLSEVQEVIDSAGGFYRMGYTSLLYLARALA